MRRLDTIDDSLAHRIWPFTKIAEHQWRSTSTASCYTPNGTVPDRQKPPNVWMFSATQTVFSCVAP
jgi:hypothetical protein